MKKTHWLRTTLITLAVCCIAGIVLALISFNANPGRTGVSSSIEFSFKGAAEGNAPNGYRYDLSGFTLDEVLEAALNDAGLADRYTADQIRANLLVSGVYPRNIVEQMTRYESVLTGDASKVRAVDYHATLYNVALYNDFDKSIARADLENLLSAVMAEFRAYFEKTYSVFLAEDSLLAGLEDYDYPYQLEILEKAVLRGVSYADEMAEAHPDFLLKGEGFADIAARYRNLQDSDLGRLNGLVTINVLSRDPERIAEQYENRIRVLKIHLKELTQEAEETDALISGYRRDGVIYVSTTGSLQQIWGNSSIAYDTLAVERQKITEQIAALEKELAQVQMKLSDIRSKAAGGSEEDVGVPAPDRTVQAADVAKDIAAAVSRLNAVTDDFSALLKAYSEREMNDRTVAVTSVKYRTPKLLSSEFAVLALKTAGPLCVLGLIACLTGLIISRRKQEKKG